jgi:hypothetical protein
MIPRAASKPLVVSIAASLVFGTTFLALAQRWSTTVTRVTVCVRPNGLVRLVTDRNPACTAREQPLEWVVGGEVTDIAVGEGLVGGRDDGRVELALDPSLLEACTACRGGRVFAGFNDGPGTIPTIFSTEETIAELDLPAGSYAIFAKVTLSNNVDAPIVNDGILCRLSAEVDFDEAAVTVEHPNFATDLANVDTLNLQVVHDFPDPGSVALSCAANFEEGTYRDVKIFAIEASQISNVYLEDPE